MDKFFRNPRSGEDFLNYVSKFRNIKEKIVSPYKKKIFAQKTS